MRFGGASLIGLPRQNSQGAQRSRSRRFPVPGGWTVTRNDVAPIHTFTSSEDGWLVNSHVIEFPSQLFVIDAQYTLPNAREVVRYARGLRKPMTRLIEGHEFESLELLTDG